MNFLIHGQDTRYNILESIMIKDGHNKCRPADIIILDHTKKQENYTDYLKKGGIIIGGSGYEYSNRYRKFNSVLTAEGALSLIIEHTPFSVCNSSVLILGYGFLGKEVAAIFTSVGANVTVAVKTPNELKSLTHLNYDIIINTIPAPILNQSLIDTMHNDSILLELASTSCLMKDVNCPQLLIGNGLPGRFSPKSAARNLYMEIKSIINGGNICVH